jgi:hypothetical protein
MKDTVGAHVKEDAVSYIQNDYWIKREETHAGQDLSYLR